MLATDPFSWLTGQPSRLEAQAMIMGKALDLGDLRPWHQDTVDDEESAEAAYDDACASSSSSVVHPSPPFPVDSKLNAKVFLYEGDMCALKIDAITNFTNETYDLQDPLAARILNIGGDDLMEELDGLEKCRSGEARSTRAVRFPCRTLIHTVGPRYNPKYQTAAENTLNACIRECMKLVVDAGQKTIALPCIYSDRKNFPRELCGHVTLRSVRRWMERLGDRVDAVVLVAARPGEKALFRRLMPLYFPRNLEEESKSLRLLPENVGNSAGETEVAERRLKISNLMAAREDSDPEDSSPENGRDRDDIAASVDVSFTRATREVDSARRVGALMETGEDGELSGEALYTRYLKAAQSADLREIEKFNFISLAGRDHANRNVIAFKAALFPGNAFSWQHLLMHIVATCDPYVKDKFTLLFLDANVSGANHPSLLMLREVYNIFNSKYQDTMDIILVLHPTLLFKTVFTACWPLMSARVWDATVYCDKIEDLKNYLDPEKLELPPYVRTFDESVQKSKSDGSSFFSLFG
uniref:Macro domain-containing protein n=1 Tax=Chromera velia CCMP2878 TaxID=1169474 RepID=A0A0G4G0Q1_9ALVE|eukprot:Cvel_4002.t1-p1 / transcript=Cvel_4002.t1 / gene=Cvel_4002 / organism=Chromera_velia_CCMP2878 / gene_product=Ganglioside-induced differentiation-associated, putative / transcript_product=Ganglioside-induced differentiation-associated, putative / location=Cvel_scaffold170:34757-41622(-) / protein_length=525 / sequence_SO=supercontig / SO=protein_coding / is_pseudo=false